MAGLRDLPIAMRVYLVTVLVAGCVLPPAVAIAAGAVHARWVEALVLFALAVLAERFTIHLTHKTAINVSSAPYLAAVLILPPAIPGAIAMVGGLIGHLSRQRRDPIEVGFNASVRGLSYLSAAYVYANLRDHPHLGPDVAGFGGIGAVVIAAATAHLISTVAIATAAGLQLQSNPLRIFAVTITSDLAPEAAITAIAIQIAFLAKTELILAPVAALPLLLVYIVFRESVQLRADTHRALADLVEVVELRDPYTAGHSRRVAETARALALRLGLTHEEADFIESAGRVHDLGKVAIDPAVLMKPGRLTDEEMTEMQRHPALGADVVARFAAYGEGWRLVRHHHERWDGKGYPDGLSGADIPMGARILAVADTYDALTSARPYREAKSTAFAIKILTEGAGTQWERSVVDALLAHLGIPAREEQSNPAPDLAVAHVA
jgi:HD-GYP domain-containing protein (c-di-GMP phosphodiesterase class II)